MSRTRSTPRRAAVSILGAALTTMLVVLAAAPATAGGWWTYPQLDTEPMSPGEEVTASASVMFRSTEEAEAAEGRYYAYLVRGIDHRALQEAMNQANPEDWWSTPDETMLLGRIEFGETDTNLRRATVTFVVPDLEGGAYSLMFCTRGCAEPLGDVIPREGVYVGDPVAVQLIRDSRETDHQVLGVFDDLEARLQRIHRSVGGVGSRVDDLDTRAGEIARSVDGVELSMSLLRERIDELEAGSAPAPAWLPWAGWFAAGLALAIARSTRRPPSGHEDGPDPAAMDPIVIREDEQDREEPEFVTSF